QPTHLAVAFDVSRATFRAETYTEYKATRSETPDDFKGQVELIKEVLNVLNIPMLSRDRYEADDIIATLTSQAAPRGYDVLICTGDRDALQLVSEQVTVLYPKKGVSELVRFDPAGVEEKYGLTPRQYPDFAALRGDPSDNLPGLKGVGEKTATKWILQFGSLDEWVDRVDEVTGKVGDTLRENLQTVVLNRQLTELVHDVALERVPNDLEVGQWDREAVHRLFDELEFRVLRERLFATLATAESEATGGFELDGAALGPGELAAWLAEHAAPGTTIGISARVHGTSTTADIRTLSLATVTGQGGYIDVTTMDEADEQALAEWLADDRVGKVGHDLKTVLHGLRARGWQLRGLTMDTALAAYLVRPGQRSFALDDLALRYLQRELRSDETAGDGQLSLLDTDDEGADPQLVRAELLRATAIAELAAALTDELTDMGSWRLLATIEMPLLHVITDLEAAGIAVDADALT